MAALTKNQRSRLVAQATTVFGRLKFEWATPTPTPRIRRALVNSLLEKQESRRRAARRVWGLFVLNPVLKTQQLDAILRELLIAFKNPREQVRECAMSAIEDLVKNPLLTAKSLDSILRAFRPKFRKQHPKEWRSIAVVLGGIAQNPSLNERQLHAIVQYLLAASAYAGEGPACALAVAIRHDAFRGGQLDSMIKALTMTLKDRHKPDSVRKNMAIVLGGALQNLLLNNIQLDAIIRACIATMRQKEERAQDEDDPDHYSYQWWSVGSDAAKTLGKATRNSSLTERQLDRIIHALLVALGDEREGLRTDAAKSLGMAMQNERFNGKWIVPLVQALLAALRPNDELPWNESGSLDRIVQIALIREMELQKVIQALLFSMHDENIFVAWGAVKALGEVARHPTLDEGWRVPVIEALLAISGDDKHSSRDEALRVLGKAAGHSGHAERWLDSIVRTILVGLGSGDKWIQKAAAEALGEVAQNQTLKTFQLDNLIERLLAAARDNKEEVRITAREVIGKIAQHPSINERWQRPVIHTLLPSLSDENRNNRWMALRGLAKCRLEKRDVARILRSGLSVEELSPLFSADCRFFGRRDNISTLRRFSLKEIYTSALRSAPEERT